MDSVQGHYGLIIAALYAVIQVAALVAALEAILKTRTSAGSIAWALSLIFMPLLSLPTYLIFGRYKFRGYTKARRLDDNAIKPITNALNTALQQFQPTVSGKLSNDDQVLQNILAMPFTHRNDVELLIDGSAFFSTLFRAIDSATDYIALSFYIVRDDRIGGQLQEHVLRKAAQGVTVYFIYDEIGCLSLNKSYIKAWQQAPNVAFVPFSSTKGHGNQLQLNFRNHRKIAIIDGQQALLGGLNIADEYAADQRKEPGIKRSPWRDTAVAITGPAVSCVQLAFLEDWYWATKRVPQLNWEPQHSTSGTYNTLVISTGPADKFENCSLIYLHLINLAQRELTIVSPFFVPNSAIVTALHLAALRGVDVRILLPQNPFNRLVDWSSQVYLAELLPVGVKFYRYQRGFLHQKVWLIDGEYASVGSTNLDNRSFALNFETNLLVKDRAFASQVQAMLVEDLQYCRAVTLDEITQRPLYKRLLSRMAHLMAPVQ